MDTANVHVASVNDAKVVQHVTKKSSVELLRKFAELGSEEEEASNKRELRLSNKRLKKRREDYCDSPSGGGAAVVERRSLLPSSATRRRPMLLRQFRARDIRNRSLLGTIQKTWHRTVEGASRVFIQNHYHRHKRLINSSPSKI